MMELGNGTGYKTVTKLRNREATQQEYKHSSTDWTTIVNEMGA
jgi:hypothetical protein